MDIIHLLPDSVANQIAAGEVIQRPASVVKELVENSLDAGASHITLIVQDAGRTLLQVVDDGKGMSETDVRMAFERHATSKIRSAADLFNLHTMGFRGEALASIVAVAHVEVLTRRPEDEIGTHLVMAGSKVELQEPEQCAVGTTIKVKDLFFNVPARRRFLKSNTTEFRNIITEFYRMVLVNAGTAFTLVSDDEIIFDLPQQTDKQRIEAIFWKDKRKNFEAHFIDIDIKTQLVNIHGFIGKPETAVKNSQQYFFVNNRYMKHPYFHKAVMNAYQGLLQPDTAPSYFIYFDISPDTIDVNIHPTKTEIKFADEQAIWQILYATVKESLGKFDIAPSIDFDQANAPEIPPLPQRNQHIEMPRPNFDSNYNPFRQSGDFQSSHARNSTRDWEKLYEGYINDKSNLETPPTLAQQVSTDNPLNADSNVFQFKEKYILTPVKSGLLWIDQHRAHTCILYYQYRDLLKNDKTATQQLLFPETINLTIDDSQLMTTLLPDLKKIGFEIEKFGPYTFVINGVPVTLEQQNPQLTLQDILAEAKASGAATEENFQRSIALSLAKATSIPYGKKLSAEEMNNLINRLFECPIHAHTPDGDIILYLQTQDNIDRQF